MALGSRVQCVRTYRSCGIGPCPCSLAQGTRGRNDPLENNQQCYYIFSSRKQRTLVAVTALHPTLVDTVRLAMTLFSAVAADIRALGWAVACENSAARSQDGMVGTHETCDQPRCRCCTQGPCEAQGTPLPCAPQNRSSCSHACWTCAPECNHEHDDPPRCTR